MILACNQATGINSIIGYNTTILLQAGLSDVQAHWGYVVLTLVNFLTTIAGSCWWTGRGANFCFRSARRGSSCRCSPSGRFSGAPRSLRIDCAPAVQALVAKDQSVRMSFHGGSAAAFLASAGDAGRALADRPSSLTVIFSYGGFRSATKLLPLRRRRRTPVEIRRGELRAGQTRSIAFFSNPFANLD